MWTVVILLTCNQAEYDKIYKAIIQQTLAKKVTTQAIQDKNQQIEELRALCNQQRSSYERDYNGRIE